MLDAIARATEPEAPYPRMELRARHAREGRPDYTARARRVRGRAHARLASYALVVPTLSGRTARILSAHRPTVPIPRALPRQETVRRCGTYWG